MVAGLVLGVPPFSSQMLNFQSAAATRPAFGSLLC